MSSFRLPRPDFPTDSTFSDALMDDNLQYPAVSQYAQAYYASSLHGHMHAPAALPRPEQPTRKRPKYTRSKTGCLTCRAKKVKCDEAKPDCTRCQQGQRECRWPDGVPARKKPSVKRDSQSAESPVFDARPSTAGSSVSDLSTPPIRNLTPPAKLEPMDMGLPPLISRRQSDSLLHAPVALKMEDPRQHMMLPNRSHGYPVHSNVNTHMLSGLLETSQYPTHNSYHGHSAHHYAQGPSMAMPRISHQDQPSLRLDRLDSSVQPHWGSPHLLQHVDPIQPFFPSMQERNLIRHYCDNALSLIMALPSENPVLAANLQLVLSRAPGYDTAIDALRKAILGVAATHQSYLFSRSGVSSMADDAMQMAKGYRSESKQLLAEACATAEGMQSDASLAASVAIALLDIFSSGRNWAENLNLAKALVNMRGGPSVLLARSTRSKPGTISGVSRARLLLEIVAVYDVFGCLSTGQEPMLLSPNTHCWWLEAIHDDDNQSHVEKCFGMSRTFLPLFATVTAFLSRSLGSDARSPSGEPAAPGYSPPRPNPGLATEARTLYNSLESWPSPSGLPERVQVGNCIYRNAAQITLLREVLHLPPDDIVVQRHVNMVLTLCLDCGQKKLSVDLNWPVIIAGSQTFGADRTRVMDIFEFFRAQCCYEVETSEHIVLEVWKRLDDNLPRADWRSIMQDQNLDVLIL